MTDNATARERTMRREGDLLRAAQRERDELRDEVARLRAALADSQLVCGAARERAEDMSLALRDSVLFAAYNRISAEHERRDAATRERLTRLLDLLEQDPSDAAAVQRVEDLIRAGGGR